MYVIVGGTGHVGSAVADTLLGRGEAVTIITRQANHADAWRTKGAEIVEASVEDICVAARSPQARPPRVPAQPTCRPVHRH